MNIKDGEILYRYARSNVFPEDQDELPSSIFNDSEMSCDWRKYQLSPENSPQVINGRNMIIAITVCDAIRNPTNPVREGEIVAAWTQQFLHDPVAEIEGDPFAPNESHSLIKGKKKTAVTKAIIQNSTFKIVL
jgi:hypothetical protein